MIRSTVLKNSWLHPTSNYLLTHRKELGYKTAETTEYHPQSDWQVQSFNLTMISILRKYLAEHRKDKSTCTFPLAYVCRLKIHRTPERPPFMLWITWLPPGPTVIVEQVASEIGENGLLLTCRLCLICRAAVLGKPREKSSKKRIVTQEELL